MFGGGENFAARRVDVFSASGDDEHGVFAADRGLDVRVGLVA